MKASLKALRESFRSTFWPLPSVLALLSLLLAEVALYVDEHHSGIFGSWFHESSAEGLRAILTTTAGGTLTLAGLVFSSTLVALTLASSQFGPRLLRNFVRARCNQFTLGLLLGNFIFALVVLRNTRVESLPHLSVFLSFLLTLASLAMFIWFVHHLVMSLQADNVVASVARSLQLALEKNFPKRCSSGDEERKAENDRKTWEDLENEREASSTSAGYVQLIDQESLMEISKDLDCRVRILIRPGRPVLKGTGIFAYEKSSQLTSDEEQRLLACFVVGKKRTSDQDFEFSLRQLVEVGMRSLSPGINDPFTAMTCIDLLTAAMAEIAGRDLQSNTLYDADGTPRVRTRPLSFRNLLDTAFLQLRHDGAGRPDVVIHLLDALRLLVEQTRNDEQRNAVVEMANLIREEAISKIPSEHDQKCIREVHDALLDTSQK